MLSYENSYTANIRAMKKRLFKLQDNNKKVRKLKVEKLLEG